MNAQDKKELDAMVFGMVMIIVCGILIALTIWAYFLQKEPVPLRQGGYKAAWQPCAPVDTMYWYLEGAESEQVGEVDNAVGCPVEINKYLPVVKD